MEQLSDPDREDIRSYIMFKLYQQREQEKLKKNGKKNKGPVANRPLMRAC